MKRCNKKTLCLYLLLAIFPLTGVFFLKTDARIENQVLLELIAQASPDMELEAMKAQAIIIRTTIVKDNQGKVSDRDRIRHILEQNGSRKVFETYETAVKETEGVVAKVNDELVELPFHKVSNGSTRAADEGIAVSMSYLCSVSCAKDVWASDYSQVFYFSKNKMEDPSVVERYSSGYVKAVRVNEKTYTGEEFREKYQLPSACFTIDYFENKVRIVTKGIGHGFGLSQNTANELACKGKDAYAILHYFFENLEFEKNE